MSWRGTCGQRGNISPRGFIETNVPTKLMQSVGAVSGETAPCAATSHVQLKHLVLKTEHARPHGAAEAHRLRPGAFSFFSAHHISLSSLNIHNFLNLVWSTETQNGVLRRGRICTSLLLSLRGKHHPEARTAMCRRADLESCREMPTLLLTKLC